jgi:hypothetical protein
VVTAAAAASRGVGSDFVPGGFAERDGERGRSDVTGKRARESEKAASYTSSKLSVHVPLALDRALLRAPPRLPSRLSGAFGRATAHSEGENDG